MSAAAPTPRHDTDETDDVSPAARRLLQAVADRACPTVQPSAPAGLGVEDDEALSWVPPQGWAG